MLSVVQYISISEILKCEKYMHLRIDEKRIILWPTTVIINHLPLVKSLDNETISHLCVSKH